jgi:hypothetical protein
LLPHIINVFRYNLIISHPFSIQNALTSINIPQELAYVSNEVFGSKVKINTNENAELSPCVFIYHRNTTSLLRCVSRICNHQTEININ